jgi:hypothetical protein
MDILSLVLGQLNNKEALSELGNKVGANPDQVKQVTQIGLPTLIKALSNNASTPQGAESLAGALDQHQDDKIDDIMGYLKNVDSQDGQKILNHVLANKNQTVQSQLAKQVGLDTNQVSGLLSQLAPLLLGALGQQKKEQNLDTSGISSLLSQLTGTMEKSGNGGLMGMVANILDADKDGDIMDDVSGILGSLFKK